MSMVMEEEFKRWTAKRKAALVTEIIQGKTTVAEPAGHSIFRRWPCHWRLIDFTTTRGCISTLA
ncbi:hypothetical protein PMI40_02658 [Herbaspirillum sp. YR522]|nr:hypothetical protein PMI40_02658 [Herbaspirillum sp. YR522]